MFSRRTSKKGLLGETSIFPTEVYMMELALGIILAIGSKGFIIHLDSFSVLLSIGNERDDDSIVIKLLSILDSMSHARRVVFSCILSHVGVQGSHGVYLVPRSAFVLVGAPRWYALTWNLELTRCWWGGSCCFGVKVLTTSTTQYNPFQKKENSSSLKTWREETILTLLYIDHTKLTLLFILKQELPS